MQQQQGAPTGKKKPLFTRPKTFAAQLGGRRPGVIYAISPTLKKKIRETKDPLEKSMLANSGWRGEASLESTVESIKTRHTAFLQEMDDRQEQRVAENNKKRLERIASMQFAKSAGVMPKQPSVVRELFPEEPRMYDGGHPIQHQPQILDYINPLAPKPTQYPVQSVPQQSYQHPVQNVPQPVYQHPIPPVPPSFQQPVHNPYENPIKHTVQPIQHPVQSVPQSYQHPVQNAPQPVPQSYQQPVHDLYENPIQHTVQTYQRPVQNVSQPVYHGGQEEEPIISMDTGDLLDHQPRVGAVPVAQSSAHIANDLEGVFTSVAGSNVGMEEFSQIIGSLADAYHRLDLFIKSRK